MRASASAEKATLVRAARFSATAGSWLTARGSGFLTPPHAAQIKNVPRIKRRMTILQETLFAREVETERAGQCTGAARSVHWGAARLRFSPLHRASRFRAKCCAASDRSVP